MYNFFLRFSSLRMRFSRHSGAKRNEIFSTVLFVDSVRPLHHVDRSDIIIIIDGLCVFLANSHRKIHYEYVKINIIMVYNINNTIAYTHAFRKLWRRFHDCISSERSEKDLIFLFLSYIYIFNAFTFTSRRARVCGSRVIRSVAVDHYENVAADQSLPCVHWAVFVVVLFFHSLTLNEKRSDRPHAFWRVPRKQTHTRQANFRINNNSRFLNFSAIIMAQNLWGGATFA